MATLGKLPVRGFSAGVVATVITRGFHAPSVVPPEPTVIPVVTGLDINCATKDVIITGTGFTSTSVVTLKIGLTSISFTLFSITSTQITLRDLIPHFVSGQTYCVTVANP